MAYIVMAYILMAYIVMTAACEADPLCQAWTMIADHEATNTDERRWKVLEGSTNADERRWKVLEGSTNADERRWLPCAKGKPLRAPYCTLKAPFPTEPITASLHATTGIARRAVSQLENRTTSELTSMLMDVAPAGNSTRVWQQTDGGGKVLRDVSGPFACGAAKTCLPATTVTAKPGPLPFLLYVRHGTLELYVGTPLMLVQTTRYGKYPQARGRVGFAVEAAPGVELKVSELKAWKMNLAVLP